MNITFMIGNGFDVGLGIHSRFKDFFPTYIKKSTQKPPEIKRLSESIKGNFETWSDFETQMGLYTSEFDVSNKHLYPAQFRDFETEFIEYLKNDEQQLSFDDVSSISKMMISALTTFYSVNNLRTASSNLISGVFSNNGGHAHTYNFISFNYTSTLEKCLKTIPNGIVQTRKVGSATLTDRIGKTVHVHGAIDHAPIMGVNDDSQIANKELAKDPRFARYIVKPTLNSLHRTNQDRDAADLINGSQIICVYGMALGATDKCWWERVLQWLSASQGRQLVIFDYDPSFNTSSQFDWIDKEDSIIDKLAGYVKNVQIDVESLRSRIHIAVHKNIFEKSLRILTEKEIASKLYGITDERVLERIG